LGRSSWPLAADQHVAVANRTRFDLLAVEEGVVLIAEVAGPGE
jgi:hypothetical protein